MKLIELQTSGWRNNASKISRRFCIIPYLQDWTAFFETTEDYVNFYIISAVVKIIKSFNVISAKQFAYLDSIEFKLRKSPYHKNINMKRAAIWQNLIRMAAELLTHANITTAAKKQLTAIANYQPNFRKPANFLQQIQYILTTKTPKIIRDISALFVDLNDALTDLYANLSDAEKIYFLRMNTFSGQLYDYYYQSAGKPSDDNMNQLWYDLETLRSIQIKYLCGPGMISQILTNLGAIKPMQFNVYYSYPFLYKIPLFIKLSWITPEDYASISKDILKLLDEGCPLFLVARLHMAIFSGGIRVQELQNLNNEQIAILVSPCAIYLYNSANYIRCDYLRAPTVSQIEANILHYMEIVYKGKTLPTSVQQQYDQLLIERSFDNGMVTVTPAVKQSKLSKYRFFSCLILKNNDVEAVKHIHKNP